MQYRVQQLTRTPRRLCYTRTLRWKDRLRVQESPAERERGRTSETGKLLHTNTEHEMGYSSAQMVGYARLVEESARGSAAPHREIGTLEPAKRKQRSMYSLTVSVYSSLACAILLLGCFNKSEHVDRLHVYTSDEHALHRCWLTTDYRRSLSLLAFTRSIASHYIVTSSQRLTPTCVRHLPSITVYTYKSPHHVNVHPRFWPMNSKCYFHCR